MLMLEWQKGILAFLIHKNGFKTDEKHICLRSDFSLLFGSSKDPSVVLLETVPRGEGGHTFSITELLLTVSYNSNCS